VPLLQAFVLWLIWTALMGLGQFIYDYQTLIGAFIALGAAYWAAYPVYEQLKATQTQANGVLRDMLLQRQSEIQKARASTTEKVGRPLNNLSLNLGVDGEVVELNAEEAFGHDQGLSQAAEWLRRGYGWRDSPRVEAAKGAAENELDNLVNLLNDIHAPAHVDQVGEDYAMTDEEWTEFVARGVTAQAALPAALTAAQTAYRAFLSSLENEQAAIELRLGKVNEALTLA
jgi:hypothetical protein